MAKIIPNFSVALWRNRNIMTEYFNKLSVMPKIYGVGRIGIVVA